ncbi:MAG TPA: hypothetical protein DCY24_02645 [Rikenellaceae bacterium]|nr:hypothetical protein [Rikenellaceae bacterium]
MVLNLTQESAQTKSSKPLFLYALTHTWGLDPVSLDCIMTNAFLKADNPLISLKVDACKRSEGHLELYLSRQAVRQD